MCGIHLIWGKGANPSSIQTMVEASRHRGPEQEAIYSPWSGLWIGVNRLRIVHTNSEADQPFWTQDKACLLIWNGEIYNFQELRIELQSMGVNCITQSDTEVLMYCLKFFGTDGLQKMQGMFALIYVDLEKKSVLVARDPNGEKPLYYSKSPDTLIISSETRGIAQLHQAPVDLGQLEQYVYFRFPSPEKTFFKGINEWKPGSYSLIDHHSAWYWGSLSQTKSKAVIITQELFRSTLQEAVRNQFHADVPVGIMLSGGMDSSLLYALWYQQSGTPLPVYTIQVEKKYQKKYSDADSATRVVKAYPAHHQLLEIDQQTVLNDWEDYIHSLDQPIGDSAGLLTWMIGKKAKEHVKVLVSGAGADELWGGYQRHRAFHHYLQNQSFWKNFAPFLQKLPLGRAWQKFNSGIRESARETFLNFSALGNPNIGLNADYLKLIDPHLTRYKAALDFDRKVYLVQDVLKIQDNALMAHSIEGRSPFLHHPLIELWKKTEDPRLLLGKPWIGAWLKDLNLEWINQRRKTGFGLPLLEWFEENGPFAQKVFSTLHVFGNTYKKELPTAALEISLNPKNYVKAHFLVIYNLFLFAEWLKLQYK